MSRLKTIKQRIVSVNNTKQITRAMKMISATKLRRAQQNIENARPYARSLKTMVHRLQSAEQNIENEFFIAKPRGKARVLIITSDKGLCGAMNSNVLKSIPSLIENELLPNFDSYEFIAFGKKGYQFLKRSNLPTSLYFIDLKDKEMHTNILDITRKSILDYKSGEINALFIVHSHFVSLIKQTAKWAKIIPIEALNNEQIDTQYIFEPEKDKILEALIPLYAENQSMEALFDNIASEHTARMIAMDAATKNATELISKLKFQYNRARQATITKELIEIISGAEVANN